jgi:predicted PhzF superfamily epimerase YddE/YHI9
MADHRGLLIPRPNPRSLSSMHPRYLTTDVFTDHLFGGNQLAVFPDAAGIAPELMAQIAREFN